MTDELQDLMEQCFALERQRDLLTAEARGRKADVERQLKDLDTRITLTAADIDLDIGTVELRIRELALARASSFKCPWGSIRYTKGYDRVTYDSKALDVLWRSALKFSWLGTHRKSKPVTPRVKLEIFTEERDTEEVVQ